MNCPHCGRDGLLEGSRFCPFCTKQLPAATAGPEAAPGGDERAPLAAAFFPDFEIRAWRHGEESVQVMVHSSPVGDMHRPVEIPADLDQLRDVRGGMDRVQW